MEMILNGAGELVPMSSVDAAFMAERRKMAADATAVRDAVRARDVRDTRLAASDWVVVKAQEEGKAVPAKWKAYRKALRDIPSHKSFPNLAEDDWPKMPT